MSIRVVTNDSKNNKACDHYKCDGPPWKRFDNELGIDCSVLANGKTNFLFTHIIDGVVVSEKDIADDIHALTVWDTA